DDGNFDDIADADFFSGALAADLAGALIDIPPVIEELFIADQAVDEVFADLHEEAEVGDAGDDAHELLADALLEELEDFYLAEFALGVVGSALGEADVLADFLELVVGDDIFHLGLFLALLSRAAGVE